MSLPLLIIGPNSTMLISGNDMPTVPITATDDLGKKNQVKAYLSNPASNLTSLMNIDVNRITICLKLPAAPATAAPATTPASAPAPVPASTPTPVAQCAIIVVTPAEKEALERIVTATTTPTAPNVFHTTYVTSGTTKNINPAINNGTVKKLFTDFTTNSKSDELDKCISEASRTVSSAVKKLFSDDTVVYRFYRPTFPYPFLPPLIRSVFNPFGVFNPIVYSPTDSPVYANVISPILPPLITVPNYPFGRRDSYSDSNMFNDNKSIHIPRSPRGSPKVPRSRSRRGGDYEKYLKYKAKYLALKAALGK
jgi:hypothetical protein